MKNRFLPKTVFAVKKLFWPPKNSFYGNIIYKLISIIVRSLSACQHFASVDNLFFFQLNTARSEARKWTSLSQPVSRRPSAGSIYATSHPQHIVIDDLLNSQFPMNGFSTLSHVSQLDLGSAVHGLPPTTDLYTDFSFLLDRLEVPSTAGSGSSGVVPVTVSPATSNRGLSLSPLCFTHSRSRSRSNSPSPDTAGTSETSAKFDAQKSDTSVKAGGKVQKVKIPRHKRPSHQRAEAKRRTRIQVNCVFNSVLLAFLILTS